MSDITSGSLTMREQQHLRTLRALSEPRRDNAMRYASMLLELERPDAPPARPVLQLVVVQNKRVSGLD